MSALNLYGCATQSDGANREKENDDQAVLRGAPGFEVDCCRSGGYKSQVAEEEPSSSAGIVGKLRRITNRTQNHRKYRVMVVDDSIVPRTAARAMLSSTSDLRLVGEASSGAEALRAVDALKPDLVLMDVHMPVMDGPTTARAVLNKYPATRIVAWTVSESGDDLLRMMQAGCAGYVLKDVGPAELNRALMAALRSESPVPRKMIPDVLRRVAQTSPLTTRANVALTSREMQVLRAIAKGHTSKRIGADLGLAEPSVETHLHNIYKKLGVNNRGEAVSSGLKLGLITLSDL